MLREGVCSKLYVKDNLFIPLYYRIKPDLGILRLNCNNKIRDDVKYTVHLRAGEEFLGLTCIIAAG